MGTPGGAEPDDFAGWKADVERRLREVNTVAGGGGGTPALTIYTHTQVVDSFTWAIPHSLGHDPIAIEVITSDGYIAKGFDVVNTVVGLTTVLGFDVAISGTARLL